MEEENFTVTMSDMPVIEAEEIKPETVEEKQEESKQETEQKYEDEKPREKSRAQKRIETLIKEKHDLQRKLDEAKNYRPPAEESEDLDPDDFDDYDDYLDAVEKQNQKPAKKEANQEASPFAEVLEQLEAKFDDTREKHSDFDLKIRGMPILTESMLSAINESDDAGDVAYYLANNPEEASKMAEMSPYKMAITVGKIETKLQNPIKEEAKQPPKQKQTQAPEPITPVGGSGEYTKPLEDMSFSEFEKTMNAKANEKKFW